MCCNHCNICIMTYLKAVVAMGQGHILTYTLKVHILANFANLIQLTGKIGAHEISGVSDDRKI